MSTPTPAAINVFIDSDGPVADFDNDLRESKLTPNEFKMLPGIYLWLPLTPGAKNGLRRLKRLDDAGLIRVWIATKTPSGSPYAYTEKVLWYRKHFPWLEDRVIITHDKSVLGGPADFLLDDRPHKANADKFKGTFVLFKPNLEEIQWNEFVNRVIAASEYRIQIESLS